ncbi:rhombosortase [Vibrio gangliei]|uniref:rhombosortase n=1 Tax=Vibrio gangliei TaxID=2077090 RepID=UPI001FE62BA8|nr:rhombosortase [Vibrio gangliei]
MALLQLPSLHSWAEWNRLAMSNGQWWRIVTGNFTHTNLYHLAMNLSGLWLIHYIFRQHIQARTLFLVILLLSCAVGGLLLLSSLQLYVGLSGVLHGVFGFYALLEYQNGRKSSLLLVVGLVIKIIWEQILGSPTGSESFIEAPVATQAHLFGALSGLFFAWLYYIKNRADKLKR